MHMKLLEDCYEYYEKYNLKEVGELEQTLATGLTEKSEKPTTK